MRVNLLILIVLSQTVRYYRDPPEKIDHYIPFFKDTQGHWNRHGSVGYNFLLTFHSIYGHNLVPFPL